MSMFFNCYKKVIIPTYYKDTIAVIGETLGE